MPGTKEIKQRIKSVKNTKKITKAMELVAASKMKRSVARALASRLYADYSWELLISLSEHINEISHPFFANDDQSHHIGKHDRTLLVLITSNTGLCGAYNSQIIKKSLGMIKNVDNKLLDIITVGKKGDNAMRRIGQNVIATFTELPDNNIKLSDIIPLSKLIIDQYRSEKYRDVYVAYTDFISAISQKGNIRQLLPISKQDIRELIETLGESNLPKTETLADNKSDTAYLFEGDTNALIDSLTDKLTRMQIYQMILESSASEQSSRMIAMKNASDAAGEMIDDLTLVFNKARQAGITQEISEISAGMASVS